MTDALVPVLETQRLRLRGHEIGDLTDCAALWASPVVIRHIMDRPLARVTPKGKHARHLVARHIKNAKDLFSEQV